MDLIALLSDLGHTIYGIYTVPGDIIIPALLGVVPALADARVFESPLGSTALLLLLSSLAWLAVTVILLRIYGWLQILWRIVATSFAATSFRLSLAFRNFRCALAAPFLRLRSWRPSEDFETGSVDFSSLDIAVLRSAVAQPPGITVSAPELAEQFTMRPTQLQRCLDKLCRNSLIESVIGSTDGFENYRVTPAGTQFCRQL